MDINSTSSPLQSAVTSLYNVQQAQQQAKPKEPESKPTEPQQSVQVSFSSQAQQLAKAEQYNAAQETPKVVTRTENSITSSEQPSGINFISGEGKGGHINTFA